MNVSTRILAWLAGWFLTTIAAHGDSATNHLVSALELRHEGDLRGALVEVTMAIELDPQYPGAYYFRGMTEYRLARTTNDLNITLDTALADFDRAIHRNPGFADAWFQRATVFQSMSNLPAAQADFQKTMDLKPEPLLLAAAGYRLGLLKQKAGDTNSARQLFLESYVTRGNFLMDTGHTNRALDSFKAAIALDPNSARSYFLRGIVSENLGNWPEALAADNQAIARQPNFANAFNHRSIVKGKTRDWDGALADVNRAIVLNSNEPSFYQNRAKIKETTGDVYGALTDQNTASRLKENAEERREEPGF